MAPRDQKSMGSCCRRLFLAGTAVVGILAAGPSRAEEPAVVVSVRESGVWDSNPMMATRDVHELRGETTTPRLTIQDLSPTHAVSFSTWVENSIFNRSEFNTTDSHATLGLEKKNQRWDASLSTTFNYDSTRTSELTPTGTEADLVRHLSYAFAPTVGFNITPIRRVEITGSYYKSRYESLRFVDYHNIAVTPKYIHNFSEIYAGVFSINARRYESDDGRKHVRDTLGPSVGLRAKLSPRMSVQAYVGREASQDRLGSHVLRQWAWSTVYSGDVSYKGQRDNLKASLSRAQQSYGTGGDSVLTSIALREDHKLSPYLTTMIGATYQFVDKTQHAGTTMDTQYGGDASLTYHVVQELDLSTSYKYRHKTFTDREAAAEQNIVRMGLDLHTQFDELF